MLRLVSVFSNGILLQQKAVTDFRGYAAPDAKIVGTLLCKGDAIRSANATADGEGHFTLSLLGEEASFEPYEVTFTDGEETVTLHDVLFGDIWIAAGQSNMEMRNKVIENHDEVLAKAADMCLRCYTYDFSALPTLQNGAFPRDPLYDSPGVWRSSSDPASFAEGSAAATGALMRVYEALEKQGRAIPLGFLFLNLGGTPIETWLPHEVSEDNAAMADLLRRTYHYTEEADWNIKPALGWNCHQQGALFNAIMAPAVGMKARGMLWYQGESNAADDRLSETCYKMAIELLQATYKTIFGANSASFPLICSLLFPWIYGLNANVRMGYINYAMVRAAAERPADIAVTPIHDLPATWSYACHYDPIHPTNKYAVGNRLGYLMLANAYGEKSLPTAAYFKKMTRKKGGLLLRFETFRRALSVKGDTVKGFYICGKNGTFIPAEAEIVSRNAVIVKSPYLSSPTAVCYQMADLQADGNLYCDELPVAPFTSVTEETPIAVGLKPWMDATVPSLFRRQRGNFVNVYAYPARHPVDGASICYDPNYRATRLLCADGKTTCGMAVKDEDTMPLDLALYREIRFPVYARPETKISLRLTLRKDGEAIIRTCPVSFTTVPNSGVLDCHAAFRVTNDTVVEKMEFCFDTEGTGYPTLAIGDITLIPKR